MFLLIMRSCSSSAFGTAPEAHEGPGTIPPRSGLHARNPRSIAGNSPRWSLHVLLLNCELASTRVALSNAENFAPHTTHGRDHSFMFLYCLPWSTMLACVATSVQPSRVCR